MNFFIRDYETSPSFCCFCTLGPNILPSAMFRDTLNLCSSLRARNRISHTCNCRSMIIILCHYTSDFSVGYGKTEDPELSGSKHSSDCISL
jgi:hypothetical protein